MEAATNSTACKQFKLPDLTLSCPFKYALNQNPKDIATASAAWISAYATEVFGERKRNAFPSSHLHNIAFHAYPYADAERLRTCCDFMNLLFFLDEVSDEMGGAEAFAIGNTFVRAMAGDDDALGDGSAVWRATRTATSQRRFLECAKAYTDSVAREAGLREQGEVLDIHNYVKIRREDSGVRISFATFDYALGLEMPEWIFEEPVFQRLCDGANDMICWSNDIYSYKVEAANGLAGNNVITVLMKTQGMTLQEAVDTAGDHCNALVRQHEKAKASLPKWGTKIDHAVAQYIMALECWVVGNLYWSFSTPRYFGDEEIREEIKRTHVVKF